MIELRLIQQALALAQCRNFARAAEMVHLSQPSLSRNIAELERRIGTRLFDRETDGVRVTAAGEMLVTRGAALLAGAMDLEREMQVLSGAEEPSLSVAAGPYPAEVSVGPAVARLQRADPHIKISVVTADPGDIVAAVQDGRVDLAVVNLRAADVATGVDIEPLPPHPVRFACRPHHPLCEHENPGLQAILRYPLAGPMIPGDAAAAAAGSAAAGSFDHVSKYFQPAIHVNSLALARQIVLESDALFLPTLAMVKRDVQARRLVVLPFSIAPMMSNYGFMSRRDRPQPPAITEFMAAVRAIEGEAAEIESRMLRKSTPRAARRNAGSSST